MCRCVVRVLWISFYKDNRHFSLYHFMPLPVLSCRHNRQKFRKSPFRKLLKFTKFGVNGLRIRDTCTEKEIPLGQVPELQGTGSTELNRVYVWTGHRGHRVLTGRSRVGRRCEKEKGTKDQDGGARSVWVSSRLTNDWKWGGSSCPKAIPETGAGVESLSD